MGIEIQPAKSGDGIVIHNIQKATWLATYVNESLGITYDLIKQSFEDENGDLIQQKADRWDDTIAKRARSILIAYFNNKPVGYVAPFYDEENEQQRLGALYILPEGQGKGIGTLLVQEAFKHLDTNRDIYLHVVSYNQKAIIFYKKIGFVFTGKDVSKQTNPLPGGLFMPRLEMVLRVTNRTL